MNHIPLNILQIEKQIKQKCGIIPIDPVYPRFGVPKYIINPSIDSPFRNYVDVKENQFFKPKLGIFHK
jgi:hypothetical protein